MEIEFRQLVRTVLRLWWIPVIALLIGGLAGFGVGSLLPKEYSASTQLLVPPALTDVSGIAGGSNPASTYTALITSGPVLDRVILELGLDLTREELQEKVTAGLLPGTQIIEIIVSYDDPRVAADLANAVARNFETQVADLTVGEYQQNLDNLQKQSNELRDQIAVVDTRIRQLDTTENLNNLEAQAGISQLRNDRLGLAQTKSDIDAAVRDLTSQLRLTGPVVVITDFAEQAEEPDSPSPLLLAMVGVFLGALLGMSLLMFLALQDIRLRDESQVFALPVLARTPPPPFAVEQLSMLAARLRMARSSTPGNFVLVSTGSPSVPEALSSSITATELGNDLQVHGIGNALENPNAVKAIANASGAVVVAEMNKTSIPDLEEVDTLLRSLNVPIIGTILINQLKR